MAVSAPLLLSLLAITSGQAIQGPSSFLPGDQFSIHCDGASHLDSISTVNSSGLAHVRGFGLLNTNRLDVPRLEKRLSTAFSETLGRLVSVKIARVSAQEGTVNVTGTVKNPGPQKWGRLPTVAEALAAAGEIPDTNSGAINRGEESVALTSRLRSGDLIQVGALSELGTVSIVGAVANPGVIRYSQGLTLEAAIQNRGGFSSVADTNQVTVIRPNAEGSPETLALPMQSSTGFELKKGDVVRVAIRQGVKSVSIIGLFDQSVSVVFEPNLTLLEALKRAALPNPLPTDGFVGWTATIRGISLAKKPAKKYDLGGIQKGLLPDVKLDADDIVVLSRSGSF